MEVAANIRRAVVGDIDEVAGLAIARTGGLHHEWVKRLAEDLINPERALWVVDDAGKVVGYGRVHFFRSSPDAPPQVAPDGFYLIGLCISEGYRRRGLGRALTKARLDWIALRETRAWFFTNARNAASLRLHTQLGFHEVTRNFEYPGVQFDGGVGVLCTVELAGPQHTDRSRLFD